MAVGETRMRSSLGRCEAARLAWAGTLIGGLLSLFACSGEAEVTTLPQDASGDLGDPNPSSDSPSLDGEVSDGADSDDDTISEAQPKPTGLSGRAPDGAAAGDMATAASSGSDVPDTEHCAAVSDWDPEWVAIEEEVLALV